jgi:GTP:adenosylcobinamide-phosphate guanylyltransferase
VLNHLTTEGQRAASFTALVLAGRRGPTDPIAQNTGCSHKALVPVVGVPMLVRVIRSLRAAPRITKIVISIDDPAPLNTLPELSALEESGVLSFHQSGRSPAESVFQYLERLPVGEPLLVVTADHPLLTPEMIDYFCLATEKNGTDVTVGVVVASVFQARYPASKRTFIRLRDEGFCGTNLFAFRGSQAAAAARFWVRAGQFRKRPWRLVSEFGLLNLALFAVGWFDLDAAVQRASQVIGVRVGVVQMPFAECAIDVDTLDDLTLASRILEEREKGG